MPSNIENKEYDNWAIVNHLVLSWIVKGASPQIASTLMHTQTTYQTWADIEGRYKLKNAPKTNQIKYQISTLHQGSLSYIDYFDQFKALQEQLVDLDQCKFCPYCIPIYEDKLETYRIHSFLLGLDEEFMGIMCQILSLDQLPSMSKVFYLILQGKRQKLNFREKSTKNIVVESSTIYAKKLLESSKQKQVKGMYSRSGKKLDTRFYCDSCKFYGHFRKNCCHLVGFSKDKSNKKKENNKKANVENANRASTTTTPSLTMKN